MPSPFPGMDPYLEGDLWQEFHETLANAIRAQLLPMLRPKYVALLAKRYILDQPVMAVMDVGYEPRPFYPDVHVMKTAASSISATGMRAAVSAPTVEVISPMPEEVPTTSVEIRDLADRRLVTVIELLSPGNKYGSGAEQYQERRQGILRTQTHLLEIDLIRRGARIPVAGHLPPAPYYIYLSRFQRRPRTEVWAIHLQEPLPVVPVPLLPPDADVSLDLQGALAACFELVGYERLLSYSEPPPPPPLPEPEAEWVQERVKWAFQSGHADAGDVP